MTNKMKIFVAIISIVIVAGVITLASTIAYQLSIENQIATIFEKSIEHKGNYESPYISKKNANEIYRLLSENEWGEKTKAFNKIIDYSAYTDKVIWRGQIKETVYFRTDKKPDMEDVEYYSCYYTVKNGKVYVLYICLSGGA